MFLRLTRLLFDNAGIHERDPRAGMRGVKVHENGLFLYKSDQADSLIRSRFMDFFLLFGTASILTGINAFVILPIGAALMTLPRKMAATRYFTFYAELLPHTEQVVFHKAGMFG